MTRKFRKFEPMSNSRPIVHRGRGRSFDESGQLNQEIEHAVLDSYLFFDGTCAQAMRFYEARWAARWK